MFTRGGRDREREEGEREEREGGVKQ